MLVVPCLRVKEFAFIVDGSISILKVAVSELFRAIPSSLSRGNVDVTIGVNVLSSSLQLVKNTIGSIIAMIGNIVFSLILIIICDLLLKIHTLVTFITSTLKVICDGTC